MARIFIAIPRFVPVGLAVSGMAVAANESAPMFRGVLDSVKVAATQYELGALASHMTTDAAAGFGVPDPGDQSAFASYVRREGKVFGQRDPSVDLWGNAYAYERGDEPGAGTIASFGPNGARDACSDGEGPKDGAPSPGDDVCASVHLLR